MIIRKSWESASSKAVEEVEGPLGAEAVRGQALFEGLSVLDMAPSVTVTLMHITVPVATGKPAFLKIMNAFKRLKNVTKLHGLFVVVFLAFYY